MRPAHVVEIVTPKKFTLNGLWFGPQKPKTLYIYVHGLSGSVFGEAEKRFMNVFVDSRTAVLLFNNRGHDVISKLYGDAPRTKKGYKRILAGAAHEKFKDCVDDIDGAINVAVKSGVKNIVLIGHSTGCQKSVYWAARTKATVRRVKAIVLLAPVSDREAILKAMTKEEIARALKVARSLARRGRGSELMPSAVWPYTEDAQRVLSRVERDSAEEIFTYAEKKKRPRTLMSVRIPLLVLWAGEEDFSAFNPGHVAAWFEENIRSPHKVHIVPDVGHSFNGGQKNVAKAIEDFMKERYN